ncbi:MAG: hybrid sensor histidine kinase/response regulator [Bacillota bacterium]|nr:hybrid sensor histidine kinase/response regulator [Bacillota bacterium]
MANILVVDDSLIMRKNLKVILTEHGHTVIGEATNGLQAYKEYERLHPDLVTMDITMPVMDGIKAVEKIMKSFPEAKIIMVSGLDQKKMVFEALKNGAKHYIMKPITPDKILYVLNLVLNSNNLEDSSINLSDTNDDALNNMWLEIKESKDEIVDLNKSLEEKIEERTELLEETNRKLKETVEELKMTQDKLLLSEKSAALTQMIAGISHEINTPVGICITAMSNIAEKNSEIKQSYNSGKIRKSEFDRYLNLVDETTNLVLLNLNKASDLIRSLKQVAVDQSSEIKRSFVMRNYIEDVLLSLKPELKKHKHTIAVNCDSNIKICSYPGAFSQIITNLVMNTLIHGYDNINKDDEVKINFNVTKGVDSLLFEYSDEGKGIAKEYQDKIFDAFFTTKRGSGGTGLGLNIVYNIITQTLNGTIKCESEPGLGTAFIINIPFEENEYNS